MLADHWMLASSTTSNCQLKSPSVEMLLMLNYKLFFVYADRNGQVCAFDVCQDLAESRSR